MASTRPSSPRQRAQTEPPVDPRAETRELRVEPGPPRPQRWTFRTIWDCDGPPIQRRVGLPAPPRLGEPALGYLAGEMVRSPSAIALKV